MQELKILVLKSINIRLQALHEKVERIKKPEESLIIIKLKIQIFNPTTIRVSRRI